MYTYTIHGFKNMPNKCPGGICYLQVTIFLKFKKVEISTKQVNAYRKDLEVKEK